jgi:hypothetical protein
MRQWLVRVAVSVCVCVCVFVRACVRERVSKQVRVMLRNTHAHLGHLGTRHTRGAARFALLRPRDCSSLLSERAWM